jgi:hypothetical protein
MTTDQVLIKLSCLLTASPFRNDQGATPIIVDRDLRAAIDQLAADACKAVPRERVTA